MGTTIGICLAAIIDPARAYHPLAQEYSGLEIPPEEFGGRASVGQAFKVAGKPWLKDTYTEETHQRVRQTVFETQAFTKYVKAAHGAVSFIQTRKNEGDDLIIVAGLKNTDERLVDKFWSGNNIRKDLKPNYVRDCGLKRQEIYELCNVVIDRDLEHLLPLVGSGKTLIRLLPGPRDFGNGLEYARSGTGIVDVRGWPAVAEYLAGIEALAA